MSTIDWHKYLGHLPDVPLVGSLQQDLGENRHVFTPDAGAPLIRRKSTAVSDDIRFTMRLSAVHRADLKWFFRTICKDGTLQFRATDMDDPNLKKTYQWASPLSFRAIHANAYEASLHWLLIN